MKAEFEKEVAKICYIPIKSRWCTTFSNFIASGATRMYDSIPLI